MGRDTDNEARFHRAFESHYDLILRYCLRRLAPAEANDAAAETFAVTWRRIDDLPQAEEQILWMYGVARNVVRNMQRGARRTTRLRAKLDGLAVPHSPDVASVVVANEEDRELVLALRTLSDDDQEILRLRAYEELSSMQIATILGCSEPAARKRVSRALARLRKATKASSRVSGRSRARWRGVTDE